MLSLIKNAQEESVTKNCDLVSLLSGVIEICDKLVNNTLVSHLKNLVFFRNSSMVLNVLVPL